MDDDIKYARMAVDSLLQMFKDTKDSQYLDQANQAMNHLKSLTN